MIQQNTINNKGRTVRATRRLEDFLKLLLPGLVFEVMVCLRVHAGTLGSHPSEHSSPPLCPRSSFFALPLRQATAGLSGELGARGLWILRDSLGEG